MINIFSTWLALKFVKHSIIKEDAVDVYKYGIEITVSTIIGFMLILIIGFLYRTVLQAMIFYAVFVVLRSLTGGYHASSYFSCNLTFSMIAVLVLFFSKAAESQFSICNITFLFLPALFIYTWLAPIENVNKPIEKNKRIYFKTASVILSVIIYIFSILLYINNHVFESAVAASTMFAVSILCMIPNIKKEECTHGEF